MPDLRVFGIGYCDDAGLVTFRDDRRHVCHPGGVLPDRSMRRLRRHLRPGVTVALPYPPSGEASMRSMIGRFPADAVVLSVLSAWFAVKWVELVSQDDTERCRRIADAR